MPNISIKTLDLQLEKFIIGLQKPTISKILRSVELLEQFGSHLKLPHSKKIVPNLYELRIRGQQEIRIFYILKPKQAILVHGFIKKSPKTPRKEINTALNKLKQLDMI